MQHIGMPFIIMKQEQPGIIMFIMQSHIDWIILQHIASPLVQVNMTPAKGLPSAMSIISTLHMPIIIEH